MGRVDAVESQRGLWRWNIDFQAAHVERSMNPLMVHNIILACNISAIEAPTGEPQAERDEDLGRRRVSLSQGGEK